MDSYQNIKFAPTWGTSTPPGYAGHGTPLDEAVEALVPSGEVTELVVLKGKLGDREATLAGYFDDPKAMDWAAWRQGAGGAKAIFTTINRLRLDPARTVSNRLDFARDCTRDEDIERCRTILLDFDPERESDTSATGGEHLEALAVGRRAVRWLHEQGAFATLVDSGNGAQIRVSIDEPTDESTRDLIQRVMTAVAARFNTATVKLDTATGNPARLARLPGTMNRKGQDLLDRPHRRSELLALALRHETTPRAVLEAIAQAWSSVAQQAEPAVGASGPDDIRELLERVGLAIHKDKQQGGRRTLVLKDCPFNNHAEPGKAYVTVFEEGGVAAGCQATKCKGKSWHDLVALHPALGAHRDHEHLENPRVIRLDTLRPEPVQWLWPGRIPRRKVSLWFADPGVGKSMMSCAVAAAVTTGTALPEAASAAPADVLICTTDDDPQDTIIPRVEQAGGDRSRIRVVADPFTLNKQGLAFLREAIAAQRPALVIIDSLDVYAGATVDMHRTNHVRPMFAGLTQLAREFDCAIVVIHHANKGEISKAIHRVSGSVGIVASVRLVLLLGLDPKDAKAGAIIPVKSNISAHSKAIGYRLDPFQ